MKHKSWIPAFLLLAIQLAAAPLDVWHWRNPAPQGNNLNGIAYGNGRFVAVGDGGTVMVSTNGVDWENHLRFDSTDFGIWMNSVAFGNGVFVSTRSWFGTSVSSNGVVWVRSYSPGTDAVFFCGGRFVAPGAGAVFTSSNGVQWTFTPIPSGGRFNSAAYGNGTTILVGDGGAIAASTNGIDWEPVQSGATQELTCAIFDGQRFLAAGWGGALIVSSNGVDWVNRSVNGNYYFLAAASLDGRAAFAGYSYATVAGNVTTLVPATDPALIHGMTVVNGEFWAVGEAGRILRSSNGLNWTEVSRRLPVLPAYVTFNSVVFDGQKFLTAGGDQIFASTNGANWTRLPPPPNLWISDLAWGNGRFVAVGSDISHPLGQSIATSAGGTNWILNTGQLSSFKRVYFLNGHFITVYGSNLATSTNGASWAVQTLGTNLDLSTVAYGEGKYLVGGVNSVVFKSRHSVLFSSSNLVTWSSNSVPIAEDFWDMTYGRGIFLAAYIRSGWPEGMMWSRDGVQWTSLPWFAERVLYRNGVFVIAGVNVIATSFNGREFRLRNRMFNQVPNGIAFGHGTYVVVGTGAMIIQSDVVPPAFLLSVEQDSSGSGPLLRLDSPLDGVYDLQSSSDGNAWNTLTTLQSTNGVFEFRDTNGMGSGVKLYRAILP